MQLAHVALAAYVVTAGFLIPPTRGSHTGPAEQVWYCDQWEYLDGSDGGMSGWYYLTGCDAQGMGHYEGPCSVEDPAYCYVGDYVLGCYCNS